MPKNTDDTITIRAHSKIITTMTTDQFLDIFDIYPDENLAERPFVHDTLESLNTTITALKKECNTLNIPWQLFLLSPTKLATTINSIKEKRNAKFDERLIANRDGDGRGVSLRIADRVIALQEYAKSNIEGPNDFNGSLLKLSNTECAMQILSWFDIDQTRLHGSSKQSTLEYLIDKLEAKNIRVARGVLSNKIMPTSPQIAATYKKSSGFIVHDNNLPYVFLPNEVSERTESTGRQILTLISLLVLVGKGEHNIFVTGDLEMQYRSRQSLSDAFDIAGKILLPEVVTRALHGQIVDENKRDELAAEYMLTPSALVVTLRKRDVIENNEAMQALLDSIPTRPNIGTSFARTPKMETSVRKFCGKATATEVMNDITSAKLSSIPAQYLLFGHVDKKHFAKFKAGIGL